MAEVGILLEITDRLRAFQQARRRLRVLVHRGFFQSGPVPFYFVKVTNLSSARDVVITHGWFEAAPPVHGPPGEATSAMVASQTGRTTSVASAQVAASDGASKATPARLHPRGLHYICMEYSLRRYRMSAYMVTNVKAQ